ncbi:hypothetical protein H6P81_013355 [Aristolochia fimbriata]|uniref:Cytochrome P450 n=1 Tax=Aristolochia fimbriata TaxID=158543 RepID=A0AAV7EHR0_ARIFI|nr:hypothetical protein H6P81_013355 [Aristolochia fimbriata]
MCLLLEIATSLLLPLLLLYFVLKPKISIREKHKLPPSPPKLPIIGNLHQLGSSPHRSLRKLSKKYGSVMFMHLGSTPTLVVSSEEAAQEILKTHDLVFSDRHFAITSDELLYRRRDVAFAPYGEYWRQPTRSRPDPDSPLPTLPPPSFLPPSRLSPSLPTLQTARKNPHQLHQLSGFSGFHESFVPPATHNPQNDPHHRLEQAFDHHRGSGLHASAMAEIAAEVSLSRAWRGANAAVGGLLVEILRLRRPRGAVLSVKRVESFRGVREEEVGCMVEKISSQACGTPIDLSKIIIPTTNNIVCRIALGKKYYDEKLRGGSDFHHLLTELLILLGTIHIGDIFPSLAWIGRLTGLEQVIEEHMAEDKKNSPAQYGEQVDLVDILLEVQRERSMGVTLDRDNIKAVILVYICSLSIILSGL